MDRPTYQSTEGRPLTGAKVRMRVWPLASASLSVLSIRGVFPGNTSPRLFITRLWSGCTRILPSALTRKA
ncbi:hypothetical protein D3C80_1715270 [compost metagenome]